MADSTPPKNHSASSITSMKKNPPAVLADMARHDPKRAKRIMTNRRSAMKAKQRKKMYTDALYIHADNKRLRQCLHHIVQQIRLQDTLMDETQKEIQDLKRFVWSHKTSKN
ncbi:Basic-leucine zipper transcription factor family protein [Prunus dulcis]|uniref:Basic-leucine zipper transcription factor family protein n=1 Tax=Prunus dulcis TaxID=3755 RepID=A0A4Y1RZP1_PRUDU|nr:Basic-leucine zipper transcription factor family protein [Prunus dulcis]